jgi:hypothetical protein
MTLVVNFTWGFWFLNQFISLIILLNFLIAVISESYGQISQENEMYTYMHRCEFNLECLQIFSQFNLINSFKGVIISSHKELLEEEDDDVNRAIAHIVNN